MQLLPTPQPQQLKPRSRPASEPPAGQQLPDLLALGLQPLWLAPVALVAAAAWARAGFFAAGRDASQTKDGATDMPA